MPKHSATRTADALLSGLTSAGDRLSTKAAGAWPGWLVAFSLSGIYVYLGVLDLIGVRPRTAITGVYYALVGAMLLAAVWPRRRLLVSRLNAPARAVRIAVASAGALAVWFVLNVAILTQGTLPWKFALLLLLWSLPTALLIASLEYKRLRDVAEGLVALGVIFVALELPALWPGTQDGTHFSPIEELDPISAGHIAALGAVGALALVRQWLWLPAALVLTILVAGTFLPGSRGPVLALIAACVLATAVSWRSLLPVVAPAVGAGVILGVIASNIAGSQPYLTQPLSVTAGAFESERRHDTSGADERPDGINVGKGSDGINVGSNPRTRTIAVNKPRGADAGDKRRDRTIVADEPKPISSTSIRKKWLKQALVQTPESPLWGHGVAMFVDNTEEAHRMGVAGTRTYPHNSLVESAFSLGMLGFIPFVAMLGAAGWALLYLLRIEPPPVFPAALASFAFMASMTSGEIGADAPLWAAAGLAVGLYADSKRSQTSSR